MVCLVPYKLLSFCVAVGFEGVHKLLCVISCMPEENSPTLGRVLSSNLFQDDVQIFRGPSGIPSFLGDAIGGISNYKTCVLGVDW